MIQRKVLTLHIKSIKTAKLQKMFDYGFYTFTDKEFNYESSSRFIEMVGLSPYKKVTNTGNPTFLIGELDPMIKVQYSKYMVDKKFL